MNTCFQSQARHRPQSVGEPESRLHNIDPRPANSRVGYRARSRRRGRLRRPTAHCRGSALFCHVSAGSRPGGGDQHVNDHHPSTVDQPTHDQLDHHDNVDDNDDDHVPTAVDQRGERHRAGNSGTDDRCYRLRPGSGGSVGPRGTGDR